MQTYDFIILLLLIVTTIWGARRGLAKQLATTLSLVLGYVVAVNFRQPVAQMIEVPPPWNLFGAMLALFVGTSLLVWIGFRFVKSGIEESGLKAFDTQMGALFGLAMGIVLSMIVTVFAVVMLGEVQRHAVLESFSGYNMCRMINRAHGIVPSEWQQAMRPYLEVVEEHQQHIAGPPAELYPQPFEQPSPSDAPSRYDDPLFGSFPHEPAQVVKPSPNGEQWNRFDPTTQSPSQASLQQPVFETR